MNLKDSTIVLTGASRGLGLCLLRQLSEKGSIIDACSRQKGSLSKQDEKKGNFHFLDISDTTNAKKLLQNAAKKNGGIDVLINNAAVSQELKNIDQMTSDEFEYVFRNNVFSVFNTIKYVLPIMETQMKGIIINISSRCSRRAVPRLSAYCSSKFAVRGITEAVAKEVEGNNIKCISISPGGINTDMRRDLFGEKDAKNQQDPKKVSDIICKIIEEEIQVPNGADVVIVKDNPPQIMVPEF